MVQATISPPQRATESRDERVADDPSRTLDLRRLRGPVAVAALLALVVAVTAQAYGAVVAGRLAEGATLAGVVLLAACLVGGALLDSAGQVAWAGVSDRAEGRLRGDLLRAAMHQPLETLNEQAVGEILDRVDDDTHAVGQLVRRQMWGAARSVVGCVPMWIIAGLQWWPAWLLFPVLVALTWLLIRGLLGRIVKLKVVEEMAWTDHAAAFEEAVAARDDLRTSLGRAFAIRRLAGLSAEVHRRLKAVVEVESRMLRRAGVALHAMLAGVAVVGVALAANGDLGVARLVTLFLVTAGFVAQTDQLIHHLPDIQEGLGAVTRIRQMLGLAPEPVGGEPVPEPPLDLELRDLHFSYSEGTFALQGVDLAVPAGETVALVGRTGSGKSTLASLLSRAVEPPRGAVFLGGVDVRDLDLQELRASVGVVTQRTEILAGTLAENIALFADVPREQIEAAVAELGLAEWVDGLPDGLDTLLGPGGTRLSAGEEQLVAFARLLVRHVQVVVLDEATARMDPLTEARVVAAADRLLTGRTGVLIAHRLTTIERAGHVAVLDHGRVVQQGRRAELATAAGPFRDLLEASASHAAEDGLLEEGPGEDEPGAVATQAVAAEVVATEASTPASGVVAESVAPSGATDPDDIPPVRGAELAAAGAAASPSGDGVRIAGAGTGAAETGAVGTKRRRGAPPRIDDPGDGPSLARSVVHAVFVRPAWGVFGVLLFLTFSMINAAGVLTTFLWGRIVEGIDSGGGIPLAEFIGLPILLIASPILLAHAIYVYPKWWIDILLRVRMSVMAGQTTQRRLPATPPGEIVARAMDADRFVNYTDRWIDFVNGLVVVTVATLIGRSWLVGAVLLSVMVISAAASAIGRPIAGRSATKSSAARARFGRALVSALDSARTVKLAARTPEVHAHLRQVDGGRVEAAVFEHRVQAVLEGVPGVVLQSGVVVAWALLLQGTWGLATTLMVAGAVAGFGWFGMVAGMVITEAPGTRNWQKATSRFAGGVDLVDQPEGVDLPTGTAPEPAPGPREPLDHLELRRLTAVHDDGTIGVSDVDLTVRRGELVLLLGQVGSGKSSLLSSLAGLMEHTGEIRWNDTEVTDAQTFLRPGQVAYVAQIPRVLSGTFAENVRLDHERELDGPVEAARLAPDIADAGGPHSLVGHRGVRLSGGQVQRLALARALAADAELLLADDVSSALDAATEIELWAALRERGTTVIGATSKRAALARADRVVVLDEGEVVAVGPWRDLAPKWSHLAG
ncbi:ATP-binding cassette domain-containing protein [Myceligenerans pegani]|uniref:ABC transporter ATP-binding protein n=1 Tax=Myceligenerans pegani TaxID=2776917 RepID=A0ABR9MTP5_9MICO|nr:ABC transporter ATP-binding protein [Myceligenerans sp. TRM 65318]MBE1874752.1 ABC transporter ATP-binding protein [Myceligenerans sp. TRM 65318]MBE3017023.1 ABC transporter ATP-binding protein [Myceligenerans sp. TRM 65318]